MLIDLIHSHGLIPKDMNNYMPKPGSVIRVTLAKARILNFDHYGIYAGKNEVIHFSEGTVKYESMNEFISDAAIGENFIEVIDFPEEITAGITLEESLNRAKSKLSQSEYSLLFSNCEHFAAWCRTGQAVSSQAFGGRDNRYSGSLVNVPRFVSSLASSNTLKMFSLKRIHFHDIENEFLTDEIASPTEEHLFNEDNVFIVRTPKILGGIREVSAFTLLEVGDNVQQGELVAHADGEIYSPFRGEVIFVADHKPLFISGDVILKIRSI